MTHCFRHSGVQLALASLVFVGGAIACWGGGALAQVTPDTTLGQESSTITSTGAVDQINGGATRGANLFHSFEQFSVPTGGTAHFNNAANIQNIISRVTGKSLSKIDGLLRANSSANLFLINPNGIIFGPNASLAIDGSFLASTATSLNFADGTQFSAVGSPTTSSLLTVSIPTGLQLGAVAGSIRNQSQHVSSEPAANSSVGLQVQSGKTLALVSNGIVIAGGNLTAKGGRLELGSVTANSLVNLKPAAQGWTLDYQDVPDFQDISFLQGAVADVSSGGQMQLQGRNVTLIDGTMILSENTQTLNTGSITINAHRLVVTDGAQVATATYGESNGGTLTINASESVEDMISLMSSFSAKIYGKRSADRRKEKERHLKVVGGEV